MENMVNGIELQDNELNEVSGGASFMDYLRKVGEVIDAIDDAIGDPIREKIDMIGDVVDFVINGDKR